MKNRIVTITAVCLVIAAALSLWRGGTMNRWMAELTDQIENNVSWLLTLKAASGVYATTDSYLSSLEIPTSSEAVLKALADVPPEDAIVFITPKNDKLSELVYRTVAYLGWPRPIGEARCGDAVEEPELLFHPRAGRPIKWLLFYRVKPPAGLTQTSRTIGPRLVLTPSPEMNEWKSYCSQ